LSDVLAVLVVLVAVPLSWLVTVILWRLARQSPGTWVLRERAIIQTAVAILVTVFALIFLNNGMEVPFFDNEATRLITRVAVLVLPTGTSLYFLWLVWKAR
jgi:hypothetical protein